MIPPASWPLRTPPPSPPLCGTLRGRSFLSGEVDLSARRNAFLMLSNCAQERAVAYLLDNAEKVP